MKRLQSMMMVIGVVVFFITIEGCRSKSKSMSEGTKKGPQTISEPAPSEPKITDQESVTENRLVEVTKQLQSIFFDFDRATIREDQVGALHNNTRVLKNYPEANLLLEGHCDERGTEEYNLALGERRARAVRDYLIDLGIGEKRIKTISYGESRPFALDHNENGWRQNRRSQPIAVAMSERESSNK